MKKYLFLYLFLFITFVFVRNGYSQNLNYENVEKFIQNKDYYKALAEVNKILSDSPEDLKAIKYKVNILYLLDKYNEAGDILDKIINKYKDDYELYYLSGLINIGKKKYKKAIDDLSRALSTNDNDLLHKIYLARGIAFMNYEFYDEALQDLEKSLSINNTNPQTYTSLGMVNYYLKNYSTAVQNFELAIEKGDTNPETYFNLGMSYLKSDQKNKACQSFQKACSLGNTNACKAILLECATNLP